MKILSKDNFKHISGGANAPANTTQFTQIAPTVYTATAGNITTTVVCNSSSNFGLNLSLNLVTGKIANASGGTNFSLPADCMVTTVDQSTHIETICSVRDNSCHVIDLKTGKTISESTTTPGDSGVTQLAQDEGTSSEGLTEGNGNSGNTGSSGSSGNSGSSDEGSGGDVGGGGGGGPAFGEHTPEDMA